MDPWSATDQKACDDPQCSHWEPRKEKVGTFWNRNQWILSSRQQQTNLISEIPNLTRIQSLPIQSQSVFYLAAFLLWALLIYKSQICKINEASNYTPFSSFMSIAPYTKMPWHSSSFLDIFTSQITHLLMKTKVIIFTLRWTKMLNVVVVVSEPDCASYQPVGVILSQNRVLISVWMGDLKGAIFFQLSERKLEKTFMSFPYLNSATFRHIFL